MQSITFSDLIASSFHDMKNSLMMQMSAIHTLEKMCDNQAPKEASELLSSMSYEIKRMNGNLVHMLGLYKIDNGIYPLNVDEHDVLSVLSGAVTQSKALLERIGTSVDVRCEEDLVWYLDADLATIILTNAINNSIHYGKDRLLISAKRDGDFLELRVEDNGRGYPQSMLDAFGGAAGISGVDVNTWSTGLGFYFSARVAEMHKVADRVGSVRIENGGELGGACFVVRIP